MSLDKRRTSISDIARRRPDHLAAIDYDSGETLSFGALDRASLALSKLLRDRRVGSEDEVAILMENCADYFVAIWAIRRTAMYIVPVNWHLRPEKIRYIVENSGARAIITTPRLIETACAATKDNAGLAARLIFGPCQSGFESIEALRSSQADRPDRPELDGAPLYYSEGTSGKPKGVLRPLTGEPFGAPSLVEQAMTGTYLIDEKTIYLSPAPLYHAAPIGWTMMVQRIGGTVVLLRSFDPERALQAIDGLHVTHAQFVPTHFVRMLRMPQHAREQYDLSSLRVVVHAAAPCPPEVKRQILDWLGLIVYEYYGGSERCGFTAISPQKALTHPGSVGRSLVGAIRIVDPHTEDEVRVGEVGLVYFEAAQPFEYYGEPGKSAACFNAAGWGTMGDMGYVDIDGYLYLTDRMCNMVISGGVNIYPHEIEDLLTLHPFADDIAVIGLPDPEYGERLQAFVKLMPEVAADNQTADLLIAHCRANLASYKCPRGIAFIKEMPRLPREKLLKRHLIDFE